MPALRNLGGAARCGVNEAASSGDVEPMVGENFLGRYLVEALLGRGGMGEVWAATDLELDRPVALKLIRRKHADNADYARRFRRETKVVAKLDHPNIVHLYDARQAPDGRLYMVMQRLRGAPLREVMDRSQRVDLVTAVYYAIQIAAALGVAHEVGISHRDIKPENVMIGEDGRAWVLDFGIAKETKEPQAGSRTMGDAPRGDSHRMGTSRYMAPEVVAGERADHRVDFYALGVVLYEMLTGCFPYGDFEPDSVTLVLASHIFGTMRPMTDIVPDTPESICQVVTKLLAKSPEQRYGDSDRLIADLRAVVRESVPPEHPIARRVAQDRTEQVRKRSLERKRAMEMSAVERPAAITPRVAKNGTQPMPTMPDPRRTVRLPAGFVPPSPSAHPARDLDSTIPLPVASQRQPEGRLASPPFWPERARVARDPSTTAETRPARRPIERPQPAAASQKKRPHIMPRAVGLSVALTVCALSVGMAATTLGFSTFGAPPAVVPSPSASATGSAVADRGRAPEPAAPSAAPVATVIAAAPASAAPAPALAPTGGAPKARRVADPKHPSRAARSPADDVKAPF